MLRVARHAREKLGIIPLAMTQSMREISLTNTRSRSCVNQWDRIINHYGKSWDIGSTVRKDYISL